MKIAFFDTRSYDKNSFSKANEAFGYEIDFRDYKLNENTDPANYDIEVVYGTLSVSGDTQYEITVTANSDTVKYDGEEHTVGGFTDEELKYTFNGNEYTVSGGCRHASIAALHHRSDTLGV